MKNVNIPTIRLFAAGLASAGIVAGSMLLLGVKGPVNQSTGIDFSFLAGAFVGFGLLTLLGTLAALAQRRNVGPRIMFFASRFGGGQRLWGWRWPPLAFPVARRLLIDLGWIVLVVGLLGSIPDVSGAISDRANGPDMGSISPYLEVFAPLSTWALLFLMPFVAARAAAEIWPAVGRAVGLPWGRLLVLAVSYAALSQSGVFLEAFEVDGSGILPWLTLTLIFSYCGSVFAATAKLAPTRKLKIPALGLYFLAEGSWVFAIIGGLKALSAAASTLPMEEYGRTAESLHLHLANLASLTGWVAILLASFTTARAAGQIWPAVGRIFGFPIRRLVLLGMAYGLFAENGVGPVLFGYNASQIFLVLMIALGASYAASVLWNTSELVKDKKYGSVARIGMEPAAALLVAVAPSMVVWVVLNHLPLVNAFLIDHKLTSDFGEVHLPHFGAVYDLRYPVAALVFATGLALTLPNVLKSSEDISHKPLTAALGYSVVACLMWVCGSSLSTLGHGFSLFGAIAAAGIFTMALGELAKYVVPSPNDVLAEAGVWLSQSKVRGFILGASVAFYGLLLRPVVYDVLWFAALYEYMAILVLLLMLLLVSANRARYSIAAPPGTLPDWINWAHHQQVLQTKADPRAESASTIYRRYVESGELHPLWKYLLGLLFRSGAPRGSMESVARTLHRGMGISPYWNVLPVTRNRGRQVREAALDDALEISWMALEATPQEEAPIEEEELRETGTAFVNSGANREALAVMLVSAYWQKGADLDRVVELWFPLMGLQERKPKWSDSPWARTSIRQRNLIRRRNLIESAIAHLSGRESHLSLPVATSALETPIFRDASDLGVSGVTAGILKPGQGMEIMSENENEKTYLVRSSSGVQGFVRKEAIVREPVLPNDKGGV